MLLDSITAESFGTSLRDLLLANSLLSDTVLLALTNKVDSSSSDYFVDVMLPNSPVSDKVIGPLEAKLAVLPSSATVEIENAQSTDTYRTVTTIDREINALQTESQSELNALVSYYADTNFVDSLTTLLEAEHKFSADEILLATYIGEKNFSAAQSKLSQMTPSNASDQAFMDLQGMLLSLAQDSLTVFQMNETQEALVRNIAAMPTCLAQSDACAILHIVFNEDCSSDGGNPARHKQHEPAPVANDGTKMFGEYLGNNIPNPFNNTTVIPYMLPDGIEGAVINIYSVAGEHLSSYAVFNKSGGLTVSSENMKNGVYIYQLENNGQLLGTKKMIIINDR